MDTYRVTRWCCRSGMCFECMAHVNGKGRVRVVQGDNLTKERATEYVDGWCTYGATSEPMTTTFQPYREKK